MSAALRPVRTRPILAVDDDPSILGLMTDILSGEGFRVLAAMNGAEALDLLADDPPCVVLLDMRMPTMDGWGFAKALRDRGLRYPVVVVTATMAEGLTSFQDLKEMGAKAYIAKRRMDAMVADIFEILARLERAEEVEGASPVVVGLQDVRPRVIARELLLIKRHQDILLAALGEAVIEFNETHQVVYVNPAGIRLLGRQERELIGAPIGSIFGGPIPEAVRRMEATGERDEFELADGTKILFWSGEDYGR